MTAVSTAKELKYTWALDGTLLLTLECARSQPHARVMSFGDLFRELRSLCPWQLKLKVTLGFAEKIVEIMTMYHDFDHARRSDETLMLVCTPPDEYFEYRGAIAAGQSKASPAWGQTAH